MQLPYKISSNTNKLNVYNNTTVRITVRAQAQTTLRNLPIILNLISLNLISLSHATLMYAIFIWKHPFPTKLHTAYYHFHPPVIVKSTPAFGSLHEHTLYSSDFNSSAAGDGTPINSYDSTDVRNDNELKRDRDLRTRKQTAHARMPTCNLRTHT